MGYTYLDKNKKIKKTLAILTKNGYNINTIHEMLESGNKSHSLTFGKRREKLANIEEKVEKLIEPIIQKIGYELYDTEYAKEGKNYFLRIYIDNKKGIDLNDCEKVNNAINDKLDEANYIKDQYYLEVSSPGIERILRKEKHLKQNIGKQINIKLFKKDESGKKEYTGELKKYNEQNITIEQKEKNEKTIQIIERKDIAQIKTVYNW